MINIESKGCLHKILITAAQLATFFPCLNTQRPLSQEAQSAAAMYLLLTILHAKLCPGEFEKKLADQRFGF